MPRRSAKPSPRRKIGRTPERPRRGWRIPRLGIVLGLIGLAATVAAWALRPGGRETWETLDPTARAGSRVSLVEGPAGTGAGRAESDLARRISQKPADPEPWLLWLEWLRVESRDLEAQRLGWAAYEAVPPPARREVLKAMTLALLAETHDDLARAMLTRAIAADAGDVAARVVLLRRAAAEPRPGDPDRDARIATLTGLLERVPGHPGVREALVLDLADAGNPDRGRAVLDAWPVETRDARYDRLRGRWDLDYDRQPTRAVAAFRRVLADLPHDWKTHYQLARALRILGHPDEARREAKAVARLREALDPAGLTRRLDVDLARLDDPRSRLDLADLCARVGLTRLADAWRRDAAYK